MWGVVQYERFDLVGSVAEGEAVHVLVRMHMHMDSAGMKMHKLEAMSLKRHDGAWRSLLSGDIEGLGKARRSRTASLMPQPRPDTAVMPADVR